MIEVESTLAVGIVLVPLVALWALALFHIVARRSDLSLWWKSIWSAVVILLPYIGVLLYSIVRPPRAPNRSDAGNPTAAGEAVDQVHRLVGDHESGSITDEEFASRKALVFGIGNQ